MTPSMVEAQVKQSYNPKSVEWGNVISLDGVWDIANGMADKIPAKYHAKVAVPGLVSNASPSFQHVGQKIPGRDVFWYRKIFRIKGNVPSLARLKIFKAMFGTKVFLNGREVGENPINFAPLYFDVSRFLKGNDKANELIIRVGSDISASPDSVVTGGDPERILYPPGIYDHVHLILSDDPYIARAQVVPDVEGRKIKAAIYFTSDKKTDVSMDVEAIIHEHRTGRKVGSVSIKSGAIRRGQENVVQVDIPISECKLWDPSEPFLYVLTLSDKKYSYKTRFGVRSFQIDSAFTNKALLNGRPCFIRGTNFSVHRFFEDTLSKQNPWDSSWVRKLFRRFTQMEMNAIRMVIGPAPEMWYDIADEEGMMIFDEYAIWYAYQPDVGDVTNEAAHPYKKWSIWPKNLKAKHLVREFTAWMQERWNHPSVIVWDAQNETWSPETGEAIRKVRKLDLSNRVWDNGWSPPDRRGDIREAHPYFEAYTKGTEMKKPTDTPKEPFNLSYLERAEKLPSTFYLPFQYAYKLPPDWHWSQPCVINEYSYLWLNRDGTPTILTKPYYETVLGENATSDQRQELYARYLAAVTEYWRANRSCFGILYPFGLAASIPGGATNDNFIDINALQFHKHYSKYVPDAFSALGICAELWKTDFVIQTWQGTQADFSVAVINDLPEKFENYFRIIIMQGDSVLQSATYQYTALPFEVSRRVVKIELPKMPGTYELIAELHGRSDKIVRSYRKITMRQRQ